MKRSFELVKNFQKIIFISETIPKWLWIQDHGTIHGYAKNKFNQISGENFVNFFEILSTFLYLVELLGQHGLVIDNIPDSKTLETDKEYTECS